MKKISYKGKKVSLGIDVHALKYHVSCVVSGELLRSISMPACPEGLIVFIKNHFAGAKVCCAYEAGFSGFELHRALVGAGIGCLVVHAASIEVSSRDRVKTDKRDSRKIALKLDKGDLKGIRVPSREQEAARVLHRTRCQLVNKRVAVRNQIRMRFYQFGYQVCAPSKKLSLKAVREGLEKPFPAEVKLAIKSLLTVWKLLNAEIKVLEKAQAEQAANDPLTEVYYSIPGVGFQAARILSTELGDMSQFPNERALSSFTGLTPSEYSSGEHQRKGRISRQGSSWLRHILVEIAWIALRKDKELQRKFAKLAHRAGKKRAIVAIARSLLGRARAVFRKGEVYRSQRALKLAA